MIVSELALLFASAEEPPGLLPARQQMAFSLGWHIVLACCGVAFPAMIFVVHRRAIVRDDPVAMVLAQRWAKVSAVLFAIGAVALSRPADLASSAYCIRLLQQDSRFRRAGARYAPGACCCLATAS